jgi:hypothetical protein
MELSTNNERVFWVEAHKRTPMVKSRSVDCFMGCFFFDDRAAFGVRALVGKNHSARKIHLYRAPWPGTA